MTPQTFFDNFALLADAPNGAAKLRELILQLAVQGKLVAQNSLDESASILIARLRKGQVRARKSKRRDSTPQVTIEGVEPPFELPTSWQWVRLLDVGHEWGQKKPDVDFTYIDVASIDNERGIITDATKLLKPNEAPSRARKIVKHGTLLYSTVRPYLLNIAIVESDYSTEPIASTAFAVIHPFEGIFAKYLFYYLRSRTFTDFVERQMQGVAYPAINDEKLFTALVPLPPSEEQKRIVAKIDELMRLCDELEARQQAKRRSRVRLNNATLAPLNSAASLAPDDYEQASVRLAVNFATLYDSAETVSKLRSAILQLGMQGKLVPQDPHDENASKLLERTKKVKERLIIEKRLRREELLPIIQPRAFGAELPENWVKVRLGEVVNCLDFLRKPINKDERRLRKGNIPYYGANGQVGWIDDYLFDDDLVLVVEDETFVGRILPFSYKISGKSWVNNHAHVLQSTSAVDVDFLNFSLARYPFVELTSGTTGRKKLTKSTLLSVAFRLPPLKEQRRIVAKIDQLMTLCDELESKLRQAEADSEKLMSAAGQHVLDSVTTTSSKMLDLNRKSPLAPRARKSA